MHIDGWTATCVTAAPPADDVRHLPRFGDLRFPRVNGFRTVKIDLGGASCVSGKQKESAGTCLKMKIATEIQRMYQYLFLSQHYCLFARVILIRIYKKE